MIELIKPTWPAHSAIRAYTTTRLGGSSQAPYDSLNLGTYVGNNATHVALNRLRLSQQLNCQKPLWLNQTHSTTVHVDKGQYPLNTPNADASITEFPHQPLAILTADCLPILLAHKKAQAVAAIHAGWRGLAAGIIENTLNTLPGKASEYVAWIGPAISQNTYEVSVDFKKQLCRSNPLFAAAFQQEKKQLFADLPLMAEIVLKQHKVHHITQSKLCTYHDPRFFSYRKGSPCGRIATLIWIDAP